MIYEMLKSYCNTCPDKGSEICVLPSTKEVVADKIKVAVGTLSIGFYSIGSFGRDPQREVDRAKEILEPRFEKNREVFDCVTEHRFRALSTELPASDE